MKSLLSIAKFALDLVGFLALMITLLWLLNPSIPGVHGIWQDLVQILGILGFFELVKWIYKWTDKKGSVKAR